MHQETAMYMFRFICDHNELEVVRTNLMLVPKVLYDEITHCLKFEGVQLTNRLGLRLLTHMDVFWKSGNSFNNLRPSSILNFSLFATDSETNIVNYRFEISTSYEELIFFKNYSSKRKKDLVI